METITIYYPRRWTKTLHESNKRWNVVVAHRRSGKSTACVNHLIRDAIRTTKSRYAFISPTYKQAKATVWDMLKTHAGLVQGVNFNEAELRVDFANGSRITLFGADHPDSLRGLALWGVVFDEYSQQPSNIFSEVIRPALADHKGYAIWVGTPKGKNEFYRLYENGKTKENWLSLLLTVDDTGLIDEKELEDARQSMTEDEYNQEWYCSFEASIKGAYYAKEVSKLREDGRLTSVPHDPALQVYTFWDLGISDYTVILFYQMYGKEKRMIDVYANHGYGLDHYVHILNEKTRENGYNYAGHFFPHDVDVRELTTGRSRKEVLKTLGIQVDVVAKLNIVEGINAGRLMFQELWIDEVKCAEFVDAISQYRQEWDEKNGMFKNRPLHDFSSHYADCYRYSAVAFGRLSKASKPSVFKPKISRRV